MITHKKPEWSTLIFKNRKRIIFLRAQDHKFSIPYISSLQLVTTKVIQQQLVKMQAGWLPIATFILCVHVYPAEPVIMTMIAIQRKTQAYQS